MNNEEKILEMLTQLSSKLENVRAELKTDILDVRTELKTDIQDVKTDLTSQILENRKAIVKLEMILSEINEMKESLGNMEMITAKNWRDLTKMKSVR